MLLTEDEVKEIFKKYLRFSIDGDQVMNYCLDSKYEESIENFYEAIKSLEYIIEKMKS